MKKTLLAAALIAGYAGAASAQNSVTLYGVVDIGLLYQNVKAPATATAASKTYNQLGMASGQNAGSRWGLKGVEDLGNGLKAMFVYEQGVNVETGSATGFTRASYIGLESSAWGTVKLGRDTSSGTDMTSGIDPFGASFGTAALDSTMGTSFIRYSNMLKYTSPSFAGFQGSLGYTFGDQGNAVSAYSTSTTNITGVTAASPVAAYNSATFGTTNKNRALTVGLRYANGPLLVAASYDQIMLNSQGVSTSRTAVVNSSGNVGVRSVTVPVPASDPKAWLLGGTYDFKVAKLHAAYGQVIDGLIDGSAAFQDAGAPAGNTNSNGGILAAPGGRSQSWMLGVSAPVGAAGKVFASWQQQIPGGIFDTNGAATANIGSVGYTYNMSKRTNLYAYYSYTSNYLMIDGLKTNQLGVGVRHLF